jgi:putative colanic acid biosynthesis acetyltransferase WcaF
MDFGIRPEAGMRPFMKSSDFAAPPLLDILANRRARKYSRREQLTRGLWFFGEWLLRLSPRPCFGWRCWVLRRFGARIGENVRVFPTTRILFPWYLRIGDWSVIAEHARIYNPGLIVIGERATISHGAHLCSGTHSYHHTNLPLLRPPIKIGDQAWICTEAFIGPGVRVGAGAVVGARAVVTGAVARWTVVAGNPSRPIGLRTLKGNLNQMN